MDEKQRGALNEATRLVTQALEIVERVADEEGVKYRNVPDPLKQAVKPKKMHDGINALESGACDLEDAHRYIEEALD